MKRAGFVGLSAGMLVASRPGAGAAQPGARGFSLWVWRTPLDEAREVVAFAGRFHFNPIYLSLIATERSALEAGDAPLLAALRTLKGAGLDIVAVAGDPSWVEHTRSEPPESITTLLGIQRAYRIFDGIALDLEPHTLPGWKSGTDKPVLIENYLATLALIRAAAQRQNLSLLATVHPTYATIVPSPGGASLLERAAQAVDATDLMAYRNADDALERFGGESMRQLSDVGKPWWLGVSTHAGSPPGTSYATLPANRFFPAIGATSDALAARYGASFRGIAVEDYRNTVALLKSG